MIKSTIERDNQDDPLKQIDSMLREWSHTVRDNIKLETGHRTFTIEYVMQQYGGSAPRGEGKAPMPWNEITDTIEVALLAMPAYYRKALMIKYLWFGTDEHKAIEFGRITSGRRVSRSLFIGTVKKSQAWLCGHFGKSVVAQEYEL